MQDVRYFIWVDYSRISIWYSRRRVSFIQKSLTSDRQQYNWSDVKSRFKSTFIFLRLDNYLTQINNVQSKTALKEHW